MIIDCHTHLNFYQDETAPALPGTLEKLQAEMKRSRVDFAMCLSSYRVSPGRPSTRDLVEATKDLKNIFIVAGVRYSGFSDEEYEELRGFVRDGHVKGLKFYCGYEPFYPHDTKMLPAIELAEKYEIPLMVHTGDTFSPQGKVKYAHPLHIDELAVDHPRLNIIICHLGNPWLRDTMEVVYKNKNVYTDISGLVLGGFSDRFERFMHKQLQEMLMFGVEPGNVLYGTDWPISSMPAYLDFMRDLKIPPEDKKKILYENSASLFKINLKDSPFSS